MHLSTDISFMLKTFNCSSRKDNSSIDDKYEWDSESAIESEILEALKNFGHHKQDRPVSKVSRTIQCFNITNSYDCTLCNVVFKLAVPPALCIDNTSTSNKQGNYPKKSFQRTQRC